MERIEITCAVAKCGTTDRFPAFEDRFEKDPAKKVKPVQAHPYVCLACWRAGWRATAPREDGQPWDIFNINTPRAA